MTIVKLSPEQMLVVQLLASLKAVKENIGLELVLRRGEHAVEFGRASIIRITWSSELNQFLVTTDVNVSKIYTYTNSHEVIDWLFN